VFYSEHSVVSN